MTTMLDTTKNAVLSGLDAVGDTADDLVQAAGTVAGDAFETAAAAATPLSPAMIGVARRSWGRRMLAIAVLTIAAGVVAVLVSAARSQRSEDPRADDRPSDDLRAAV